MRVAGPGVADPEARYKIIGRLFNEVFDEQAVRIGGVDFPAQGTTNQVPGLSRVVCDSSDKPPATIEWE